MKNKYSIPDFHVRASNYEANCKAIGPSDYAQIDVIPSRLMSAETLEAHLICQSEKSKEYNFFHTSAFNAFLVFAKKKAA